jgi:hypothetical protein
MSSNTFNTHTHTAGPHNSDMANRLDPRVDSDLDGSKTLGGNRTGTTGYNVAEGTYGPHSSRVANAADPLVDSDRDRTVGPDSHTGQVGATGLAGAQGTHNTHGTHHGAGVTGTSGVPEGTYGPHSSRIANALDPRVDSDRDHRGHPAAGTTTGLGGATAAGTHDTTGFGLTGNSGAPEGTYGPHSSRVVNAADPRVDSDRDHRGADYGTHTGVGAVGGLNDKPGPAPNTAGPHKSDLLNKLDPRVDSDLDGSKTIGGNKTHAGSA